MIRIGLIFPLFCLATSILLIPRYASTSELEQKSIIYEEIYGRISIIDDVIHEDKTIIIALKINLNEGWKTYWRHSGTTGLPTVIYIENEALSRAASGLLELSAEGSQPRDPPQVPPISEI